MAPEAARRKGTDNQYLFDLGKRGRKTGITIPDSGVRDENGLEPMDHLFSSPEKPKEVPAGRLNGNRKHVDKTISSEADMDLLAPFNHISSDNAATGHEDTGLEDIGMVNEGDSFQLVNDEDGEAPEQEREESHELEPEPQPSKKSKGKQKAIEVTAPAAKRGRPKKAALEAVQEGVVDEPEAVLPKKRGRSSLDAPNSPKRKTGRPKKAVEPDVSEVADIPEEPEQESEERPKKRTRRSLDVPETEAIKKAGRPRKVAKDAPIKEPKGKEKAAMEEPTNPAKTKAKAPGRKPKLATIEEVDSPQVQRGPPMPRNNRGLFILRRETPLEGSGFQQTRSGRNSIKPLAYWKNERVEYSEDENEDGVGKFVLPRIKEVVRAEEVHQPKRKVARSKSKAPKSKKQSTDSESEEEDINMEPWELEPGRIFGEVKNWDPEDPSGSQQEEVQEEIALSSAAIITRDIPHASFRFAKTLTLPFFGSGMVDLPARSMKKSKNSRKMQMVFFVFYGRVQVTVNDNVFSIGKGGMWQVPRGNFYSIENDYDKPARIFFSQGCEVVEDVAAGESQ
ncbi:putative centromere protein 3 [Rhexocercosporidium sp. MPI-PUGE-AT-0058]|nr:putative centromere protein 3 [Rhexocercosporidium sp. MPI-PUGE-AT-0058]